MLAVVVVVYCSRVTPFLSLFDFGLDVDLNSSALFSPFCALFYFVEDKGALSP